jgi:hypothetical protein
MKSPLELYGSAAGLQRTGPRPQRRNPNSLSFLPLTNFAPKCPREAPVFSVTYGPPSPVTTSVSYHLRVSFKMPQKSPNVSYHLQTLKPVTTCVSYHLRDFFKTPQKSSSVFYHLQTPKPVTTCVSYHLRKKAGGGVCPPSQEGGKHAKSNAALLLPQVFPVSPLLRYSYKKIGGGRLARRLRPDDFHREGCLSVSARSFDPTRTSAPSPDRASPLATPDKVPRRGSRPPRIRWPRRQATAAPTRVAHVAVPAARDKYSSRR